MMLGDRNDRRELVDIGPVGVRPNFRACRLVPPRSLTAQCQHPSLDVTQWNCACSLVWSGVHSTRDSWGKLDAVRLRAPRVLRTESKVDGERR
jgi:hypothetical protein